MRPAPRPPECKTAEESAAYRCRPAAAHRRPTLRRGCLAGGGEGGKGGLRAGLRLQAWDDEAVERVVVPTRCSRRVVGRRGAAAAWGGEARACTACTTRLQEGSERVQRRFREGSERAQRGFRRLERVQRGVPRRGDCALLTPLASKEVEGAARRVADNALPVAVSRRARRAHAAPASSRVHPRVAVARAPAAGRLAC